MCLIIARRMIKGLCEYARSEKDVLRKKANREGAVNH